MGDSVSGYCADATVFCVCASTTDTLIDDVPMSIPNNNMLFIGTIYNLLAISGRKLIVYSLKCNRLQ